MNIDNILVGIIQPDLIGYYKIRACEEIKKYLNKSIENEDILKNYPVAVIELCKYYQLRDKQGNLSARSQGERSETFIIYNTIPDTIKALLPRPSLRVRG